MMESLLGLAASVYVYCTRAEYSVEFRKQISYRVSSEISNDGCLYRQYVSVAVSTVRRMFYSDLYYLKSLIISESYTDTSHMNATAGTGMPVTRVYPFKTMVAVLSAADTSIRI